MTNAVICLLVAKVYCSVLNVWNFKIFPHFCDFSVAKEVSILGTATKETWPLWRVRSLSIRTLFVSCILLEFRGYLLVEQTACICLYYAAWFPNLSSNLQTKWLNLCDFQCCWSSRLLKLVSMTVFCLLGGLRICGLSVICYLWIAKRFRKPLDICDVWEL